MRKDFRFAILLLGVLMLCNGCGAVYLQPDAPMEPDASASESSDPTEPNGSQQMEAIPETNFAPDAENRFAIASEIPAPDGEGAYIRGTVYPTVSYFDFASGLTVPLCTQQGCQHQDESCLAYQGMLFEFGVYQDHWYALTSDRTDSSEDAHRIQLVQTDPQTNQRSVLWEYKNPDRRLHGSRLILSHGNAWFQLREDTDTWKDGPDGFFCETSTEEKLFCVNLETGEAQVFAPEESTGRYQFWGGSETGFAYTCSVLENPPMSEEAYQKEHPDATLEDYINYQSSEIFLNTKHRLFYRNTQTGEDTLICENVQMSDSACCYRDMLYYRTIDRENGDSVVYRLDLSTGETSLFWQDRWIVDYSTLDNKLFCITSDPAAETNEEGITKASFYCVDLSTGETYSIPNHGNEFVAYFRIDSETEERFLGYCEGRMASIRKEDFWAGHYEKLGPLP